MTTRPSSFATLRDSRAFAELRATSVRIGRDPLQVQGAGGNTSLKGGGAMWVKASGTWLAQAEARDIMVPVHAAALAAAVSAGGEPQAIDFVPSACTTNGLRPSIETALHAAMPQRVVLHTHCVATIALAIREDGDEILRRTLADFDPIVLPYVMPGLPLARRLMAEAGPDRPVAVLGNHGLIVAGNSVEEAEARLSEVSARLTRTAASGPASAALTEADKAALSTAGYRPCEADALQAVARSPQHLDLAARGPFFPDQVVFLGPRLCVAEPGEPLEEAAVRLTSGEEAPSLLLLPGVGAALRRDAPPAVEAMALGLGEVIARVPPGAPLRALAPSDVAALLGWDAEKYRQSLSAASPPA